MIVTAHDVQALKETFPIKTEEEIVQALASAAGSRNEAAEKLLAAGLSSEHTNQISRYV